MDKTGETLHKLLACLKEKHCGNVGTAEYAAQAAADLRRRWKERCQQRGVPMPIWDLVAGGRDESGNRWRVTEAIRVIDSQLEKKKRFIVLGGPPGSGKTVAASYFLTRVDNPTTYDGEFGYFYQNRDCFDEFNNPRPILMTGWHPVVIDDLGTEKPTQTAVFDAILQSRYANGLFTICTTNLSGEAFANRYDARTASRLGEIGFYIRVNEVVRPDYLGLAISLNERPQEPR